MKKIGYKLTDNFKYHFLTFEVGKEYKMSSTKICDHGFHYCETPLDILKHYDFNINSVLLKIEILSDDEPDNKSITHHIKILEVVDVSKIEGWPISKYDDNNNLIYFKDSDGLEEWQEYDKNNNLIHFRNSNGYEFWNTYDQNNNLIHFKNSNNYKEWKKYDSNNNFIYKKNSDDFEYWKKYDSNNNLIHYKTSKGFEEWKKYDKNNNLIHYKDSNNDEWKIEII